MKKLLMLTCIIFSTSVQAFDAQSPLTLEQMRDHCVILYNLERATAYDNVHITEVGQVIRIGKDGHDICQKVFEEMEKKMREYIEKNN